MLTEGSQDLDPAGERSNNAASNFAAASSGGRLPSRTLASRVLRICATPGSASSRACTHPLRGALALAIPRFEQRVAVGRQCTADGVCRGDALAG